MKSHFNKHHFKASNIPDLLAKGKEVTFVMGDGSIKTYNKDMSIKK